MNNCFFIIILICTASICCASKNDTNNAEIIKTNNIEGYYIKDGALVEASIPQDVADRMIKRFEAIENGDIAAFRSTLGEMEDGVDYYYQLHLIYKFFEDFFDIDAAAFDDAVTNGREELFVIADKLFNGKYPLKSRNSGLIVRKIEYLPDGGIHVTVKNNKNEELEYNFIYY